MKKVAVILSGCGHLDGSEIHEAVLSLWALAKYDIQYECFAPNKPQYHVMNHLSKTQTNETRNILEESARIARGNIKDISELKSKEFSALIFPGGYGAAKNLFTFAYEGKDFSINKDIENINNIWEGGEEDYILFLNSNHIIRNGWYNKNEKWEF